MDPEFVAILQKLIAEQGKETLLNTAKCKALLADYTRGDYKRESRLLLQALDAGVQKAIDKAENIVICKKQQIRLLHEDYGMDEKVAAGVVDALALVLRGDVPESNVEALVEALIEKGKEYYRNNDESNANKQFDEAIHVLNKAIGLEPNNASAYAWRGEAYLWKNQDDTAINDLNTAIGLDPKDAFAYARRENAYRKKGQYDTAINDFNEAIRLDPKDAFTYSRRGAANLGKGQYDAAINDFNEAIRLNPKDTFAYSRRGAAKSGEGQYDAAINDFNEAIRLDPNNAWSYGTRGHVYKQMGQKNQAIQDFEKALSLNTNLNGLRQELQEIRKGEVKEREYYTNKNDNELGFKGKNKKKVFLAFAKYNEDANKAIAGILDKKLSNEEREKDRKSYFGSLSGLYRHNVGATCYFLSLLASAVSDNIEAMKALKPLAKIEELKGKLSEDQWKKLLSFGKIADKALVDFIAALKDINFEAQVKIEWYRGKPPSVPLKFMLQQLIVHNTHHRGQISQILDSLKIDNDYSGIDIKFL